MSRGPNEMAKLPVSLNPLTNEIVKKKRKKSVYV